MTAGELPRSMPLTRSIPLAAGLVAAGVLVAAVVGPLALVLAILGVATVVAVIYLPGVVFAAYLLLAFYKGGVQPYSPVDLTAILAVLNIVQIVPILRERRRHPVSTTGLLGFLLMSMLVLAGVLWAPDQAMGLDRAVRWWTLVLFPIVIGSLRVGSEERYVRQFLWTFVSVGSIVVVLGMTQLSSVDRVVVLGSNTIQVARAALIVPILGAAFVLASRVTIAKAALIVLVPMSLIIAVGSGSRGPLLFFGVIGVIGLATLLPRVRHVPPQRTVTLAALGLASFIGLATVASQLPATALDRFTLLGEFLQNAVSGELYTSVGDTSAGNRVVLFEAAATMFAEHPILGVGTSGFESLSTTVLAPDEVEAWPHNSILQVAAEFGVVGLAIFLTMIILALTRSLPYGAAGTSLRFLFLFFLLNTMVSGDIFTDRETWGMMMLLLMLAPATRTVRSLPMAERVHRSIDPSLRLATADR